MASHSHSVEPEPASSVLHPQSHSAWAPRHQSQGSREEAKEGAGPNPLLSASECPQGQLEGAVEGEGMRGSWWTFSPEKASKEAVFGME